jgi:DNA (cytosine-5)-methyltransferase 3A
MKQINVFAMFDGLRGGAIVFDKLGVPINEYYSSEIDKNAIKIGRKNYPKCVELGDITEINVFDLDPIDIILMGFPCKNLSMQGNKEGMTTEESVDILSLDQYLKLKESGFKFKGESWLFWEGVRCLRDAQSVNPDVKFMIENVVMADKWADLITKELGVKPVVSCASDLLAASRPRMYWANWAIKPLIKSLGATSSIKDIMVSEDESFNHIYMLNERFDVLVPSGAKGLGKTKLLYHKASRRQGYQVFATSHKLECIDTCAGGGRTPFLMLDSGRIRYAHPIELERCLGLPDNYTEGVATGNRKKAIGNGWAIDVVVHNIQQLLNTGWPDNL